MTALHPAGEVNPPSTRRIVTRERLVTALMLALTITATIVGFLFRHELERLGNLGYLGAFLLPIIGNCLVAAPFPWPLIIVDLSHAYPTLPLVLVASAGTVTGNLLPYALGHRIAVHGSSSRIIHRLRVLSRPKQTLVVILLAFSPIFSYSSLVGAVLGYPLRFILPIVFVGQATQLYLFIEGVHFGARFLGY